MSELTILELKSKLDGHNRLSGTYEKNPNKKELYIHHVTQWNATNDEIKRREKWNRSKARQVFGD